MNRAKRKTGVYTLVGGRCWENVDSRRTIVTLIGLTHEITNYSV